MAGILAFIETRDGAFRPVSGEVLTAARKLADGMNDEVHALLLGGSDDGEILEQISRFGADRIFVVESESLRQYNADGVTGVLTDFVRDRDCRVVILPGTPIGKDLGPRVAARLGVDYAADCTALDVDAGAVVATRPRYAGKILSTVDFQKEPAILSIRPNVFAPVEKSAEGVAESLAVQVDPSGFGAVVKEVLAAEGQKLDVGEASIVVSGGRGLREPANFKLLEELAAALGAAVGASRAVVDAGWRPHAEQVGQTGKTVAPKLYFAIGISGAIQHLAGMRTSSYIVAINKDPEAPIFKVADYGIVGDLFEIVPRLTEEIRKLRG